MTHPGETAALGTAACWAIGSNLFAFAGRRMGSRVLNRLRITVAAGLLAATLAVLRGAPWPAWATPAQVAALSLSGLVGFVFGDAWYFRSLVILGPGRAALLASLAPLFTAALAWPLLHEHPGPLAWVGMLLTVGGIAWVMWARDHARPVHAEGSTRMGVLAGVLGALGQAGGYVLSKSALHSGLDPLSATVVRVFAACAGVWLLTLLERQVRPTLAALRDGRASAFMAGGAVFGPFLGVTLSLTALRFIDSGVAASITAIYPLLAMLIAVRMHGERLTWRALGGAVLAVAGVVVLFRR